MQGKLNSTTSDYNHFLYYSNLIMEFEILDISVSLILPLQKYLFYMCSTLSLSLPATSQIAFRNLSFLFCAQEAAVSITRKQIVHHPVFPCSIQQSGCWPRNNSKKKKILIILNDLSIQLTGESCSRYSYGDIITAQKHWIQELDEDGQFCAPSFPQLGGLFSPLGKIGLRDRNTQISIISKHYTRLLCFQNQIPAPN